MNEFTQKILKVLNGLPESVRNSIQEEMLEKATDAKKKFNENFLNGEYERSCEVDGEKREIKLNIDGEKCTFTFPNLEKEVTTITVDRKTFDLLQNLFVELDNKCSSQSEGDEENSDDCDVIELRKWFEDWNRREKEKVKQWPPMVPPSYLKGPYGWSFRIKEFF